MSATKASDGLDIHLLPDLQLQALWVIDQLTDGTTDRFSAAVIANYLVETCGIDTTRQGVTYALEKERGLCNKNASGYKLMEPARAKLAGAASDSVILIEAGKPFSAKNIELRSIFASLNGTACISDPYVDVYTLDAIFKYIPKTVPVKVLTQNVKDKPTGTFSRHLAELRQEGYQVEVGVHSSSDVHDRYIMDDKTFWLSGNSLNHIGSKESFIVRLGEDIRQSMLATFNGRWKVSHQI